ncbi:Zn-ribbon domain-containing OB-fold protein [Rhodococcus sp. NPDC019627]|uniref:Zn-ribbon domain-containing OB-fold protein n=1 Tax=unclassified Rhodococcus (in: high G+C Gram-positive bacteria) TaxID=192944 RepID=UPI0033C76DFA
MNARRPVPVPDAASEAYWAAAAEHVLVLARCRRCGSFALPPDSVCPHCGSTNPEFEFVPVSGRGTVRSWTTARQSFLPGFDDMLPFVLVDVELVEQAELRMIGRLLDDVELDLRIGSPVVASFEDVAPGVSIPAFGLAP